MSEAKKWTMDEYRDFVRSDLESEKNRKFMENLSTYGGYSSDGAEGQPYLFQHMLIFRLNYKWIFGKYHLKKIAGQGDTFQKAINLMQWVTDHTYYNGMANLGPTTAKDILKTSFDKDFASGAINCANKSILLAEALVSLGIFALPV